MNETQTQTLLREEERLRSTIRRKHHSIKTEKSYVGWFRRFGRWLCESQSASRPEEKIGEFLTMIAKTGVAAATQKQAFDALRFYYEVARDERLGKIDSLRVRVPAFIRIAPKVDEVRALLHAVEDVGGYPTALVVKLLYACGLRVTEPLRVRLKDVLLKDSKLVLQETKAKGARIVDVPCELWPEIQLQVKAALVVWEHDRANGLPVQLPGRMAIQNPGRRFSRQWALLFPGRKPVEHPRTGELVRYHFHEKNVQRCVKAAATEAGLGSDLCPHLLRHAYGTHAVKHMGASLIDVQRAYGHKQIQTTMNYLRGAAVPVASPFALATCL